MNTITLTNEEVDAIIEAQDPVDEGSWRWGSTSSYVVERGGKHYMFTARFHVEEGFQEEGPYTAREVRPVEVKTTVWLKV